MELSVASPLFGLLVFLLAGERGRFRGTGDA